MLEKLSHIGIAVKSIEEALTLYRDILGCSLEKIREMPERSLKVAFLDLDGTHIELLEGTGPESAISKFVEKRGGGIHHLCFNVSNIDEALESLSEEGIRLIDRQARTGAEGNPVAFLHPKSTGRVLIELEQD
ncbi:MAG: methylmalonyl-CoA epimerase [Candidatus Latescibacteria bacterium]|nr:methylmalonyl-CoA epimerase [bacterium]MBD3425569.1 methylmalonyl-CoA epimerase [Candidatus Latescibacterota bacterium]